MFMLNKISESEFISKNSKYPMRCWIRLCVIDESLTLLK